MYKENNQPTTIKEAAIRFDIFIRDGGVGSSMFFVLIMLIIVNTHSLHFLFGDGALNWIFAIFSAIGFSIATTSVIRKPVAAWMKYLFPTFDMLLVFLGFNLLNEAIPVHFIMTLLFSAFTGAILIGLGTINFKENEREAEETNYKSKISELEVSLSKYKNNIVLLQFDITKLETENKDLKSLKKKHEGLYSNFLEEVEKTNLLESELAEAKLNLNDTLSLFNQYKNETATLESDLEKVKSKLAKKEKLLSDYEYQLSELETYKRGYLLAEKSRILKKKEENRTAEEVELLTQIESLADAN
jgi:hypothetical protein